MSARPCLHKIADHQHGTYAAFVLDHCRCEPCREAHRAYNRNLRRAHLYGRFNGYVDAEPARRHVRSLMAQGMGLKRIVAVSEVSQGALWKLLYGKTRPDGTRTPSKRIRPETERRILAIRPDLADGAYIDGTGTSRRIQALVAVGWSQSKIAARLGMLPSNFTALAHGRRGVTVANARAVAALYEELWDEQPPRQDHRDKIAYSRSVAYASAHGWLPPVAWDDDKIDDPNAVPAVDDAVPDLVDEIAVQRAIEGERVALSHAETDEVLDRLVERGWSDARIASAMHVTPRTVLRWRQAKGIESRWSA